MKKALAILKRQPNIQGQVETFLKKRGKTKLNVGCGTDYKDGWINVDNNSDNNIEEGKLDLNWDLRNPLPFPDKSVDFIFNEHFFEHLGVDEAQNAMKDFMRVLKPGGVMRIAMPDLKDCVDLYLDKNWKNSGLVKDYNLGFVETPAELMNMSFRWWGHVWVYDWTELKRRLKQAGYTKVKKCKNSKSEYKELRNLEIRKTSTLVAEVKK